MKCTSVSAISEGLPDTNLLPECAEMLFAGALFVQPFACSCQDQNLNKPRIPQLYGLIHNHDAVSSISRKYKKM